MSDDAGTNTEPQGTNAGGTDQGTGGGESGYTPPATQADLDKIIGERLGRERAKYADYDELKTKAGEYDTLVSSHQEATSQLTTQLEGATSRISELEAALTAKDEEITKREFESMKADIAREKGVPAKSLVGTTREELEASADELVEWRNEQIPPARRALRSGANLKDEIASAKQKAVAAVRSL